MERFEAFASERTGENIPGAVRVEKLWFVNQSLIRQLSRTFFCEDMPSLNFSSITEQVAGHLEAEIFRGRWAGEMPGRDRLAGELGVNRKTVEWALRRLEERGVLVGAGAGRRRRIAAGVAKAVRPALRVGILAYEKGDRGVSLIVDLQHRLEDAGHVVIFAPKTLLELRRDVGRVASLVEANEADAWVVVSGPQDVLEWFVARRIPVFAMFGRRSGLPVAGSGPDKVPAIREIVRKLFELGHRRIVMISRQERRKPCPGGFEQAFLDEIAAHDVEPGSYNLPDWEETPDGYLRRLDSLFAVTPPTALILDEPFLFVVAQQHLAWKGIRTPDDVSLVCGDPDPLFEWMRPRSAHIRWNAQTVVRHVARWVDQVARGRNDFKQSMVKAVFVQGQTVGPAPRRMGRLPDPLPNANS